MTALYPLPVQLQNFSLAGSGVSIGDTSITLTSFLTIDGAQMIISDFGGLGYMTIEPGSRDREEQISFTTITYNANGTATLGGVKTVLFVTPFTQTSGFSKSHPGGAVAVVTNTAGFYGAIKTYIDTALSAGAVPATTTVNGIGHVSVNPVDAANPIFVGDNDIRVPTADPTTLFAPISTIGLFSGAVVQYAGSSAPSGWLFCDGSAVSRTTYATLFGVISTTYGTGNGTTTFNLPDYRSRVVVGAGAATLVATFASRSSNVITVTGITNAANNGFTTGQAVVYHTTGSVMTGLSNDATYYLVQTGNLTFSLASSLANAQNGTVISLSSDGSGTQTFTSTLTTRARGDYGGEENHAMSLTELLSHNHLIQTPTAGGAANVQTAGSSTTSGSTFPSGNMNSTGGNAAMNNMPPFGVANYIIKT